MGLFEEEKSTRPVELDEDEKTYQREKEINRSTVIISLVLAFIVGLAVARKERNPLLSPVMQALSQALGMAFGILIFAGIPAAIAAKFTTKWRYVWIAITSLLLVSQIIVFLYEKK